jgi:hypothetical protein
VSWKFWKKDDSPQVYSNQIPLSTLIRWYCYDLGIEEPNDLFRAFDLMPVSKEGEEYEMGESETRVDEIVGLLPFFEMIAAINAKAISTIQLQDIETEDVSEIEPELMEGLYQQVSFAALVAAFSAALELGFLNKSYNFLSIYGANKEDDDEQ